MVSPTNVIVTGAGVTGLLSYASGKLYDNMTNLVYTSHAVTYKPPSTVTILIPAFNEELLIEKTLRSILRQNIISDYTDYFECVVIDNESTDRTAAIAKRYCQVISAPRGKLNARHAGILNASGDIIVSCDSDCYYPPNWLNIMLTHFRNPSVVAVHGPYLLQGNILQRLSSVWFANISPLVRTRISGANSAFLKKAYYKIGGFDLQIDQFSREEMQREEEVLLYRRLKTIGEVVFDLRIPCFTILRGLGYKTLDEQRLPTNEYQKEMIVGERF